MKRSLFVIAFFLSSIVVCDNHAEEADEQKLADKRLEFMLASVRNFQVTADDDPEHPWKRETKPLLRWANPVGGVPDGIIVMWTDGVRPGVMAQVFQTKDGFWVHEFQSVALCPFVMREGNRVLWEPRTAGVGFHALEDVVPPADTKTKRLTQMRGIAEQFNAYDDFKIHATDAETTRHELRLMRQPLYRYQAPERGIIDGGVFAFALGTDPEAFVILEARKATDGSRTWEFAIAAMTAWAVEVKYQDKAVWSVAERLQNHSPRGDYHAWVFDRETK